MPGRGLYRFGKEERLCSRKDIDRLFNGGGSHSMAAFPLRLVYMCESPDAGMQPARVLVSVPKRCFRRAVKRNRVKRQIREAYRLNRHLLAAQTAHGDCRTGIETATGTHAENGGCMLAFIWLDDKLWPTAAVEQKVASLLLRLSEKMNAAHASDDNSGTR